MALNSSLELKRPSARWLTEVARRVVDAVFNFKRHPRNESSRYYSKWPRNRARTFRRDPRHDRRGKNEQIAIARIRLLNIIHRPCGGERGSADPAHLYLSVVTRDTWSIPEPRRRPFRISSLASSSSRTKYFPSRSRKLPENPRAGLPFLMRF